MGEQLPLLGSSKSKDGKSQRPTSEPFAEMLSSLVYASVNLIIAVPGLYGYASVIFKDPVFHPYRNDLAKLVISSSLVHQLGFTLFSSLDFAIGTVQDAGLVFLSAMSSTIADQMRDEEPAAILSTTIVLLSLGTAVLGLVLIALGKFKLANAVSFLPFGTWPLSGVFSFSPKDRCGGWVFSIHRLVLCSSRHSPCHFKPSGYIWRSSSIYCE